MKKDIPVIIKDSENLRNIFIQVDLKKGKTSILSSFSAWESLAFIMEALALTAQKCIDEGIAKKQVYEAIKKYLVEVLDSYKIKRFN